MRLPVSIILLSILSLCIHGQVASERRQPIIDVHLHAYGWDEYGNPPPPNEITGRRPTARTDKEAMDAALAQLRRYNIVKAVASGPLEDVLRWREAAPDVIIGGAFTGVATDLPDITVLRREFAAGRLSVLGELGLQYRGVAPADPQMEVYFALAEEMDIPVGIHTALGPVRSPYTCCPRFRVTLGNPALLEEVLIRHPKLRVYIMHAGWPYLQETLALMYMYPQVYADVAVINWILPREEFHDHLRSLVRAGFGKRIMFGSDQMIWPEAIGMAIEGVESASFLTQEQKRDIFCHNAARFFKWEGKNNPCLSP